MKLSQYQQAALAGLRKRITGYHIHFTREQIERLQATLGSYSSEKAAEQNAVVREALSTYVDSWVYPVIDALLRDDKRAIESHLQSMASE